MSIDNLINYIYIRKMIAIISSLKNGSDRIENLLEMVNHASSITITIYQALLIISTT